MLIDTHCHILPGLDDGAGTMDDAIEMACDALQQGIHTIVATPHHANGKYDNEAEAVENAVNVLNGELKLRSIDVTILVGQEIRLFLGLVDEILAGVVVSLNKSRYLLVELPSQEIPAYFHEMLFELQLLNITPVIAHPERNAVFLKQPKLLKTLVENGVLCQVTSQSLLGLFGKKVQKLAFELCKEQIAHLIASDAHNMGSRSCTLSRAHAYLCAHLGEKNVNTYMQNAELLIRNEVIQPLSVGRKKREWFHFLWPQSV
ncbi:tyrosine-protein phosphatase [Paenibacillus sedimenti]|uniref:Tyrosine-protein phosphatase n=1 Tax=Paenibacillus sedimenti TaxID=2770274 RepID=A0A926KL24_9BACL|nr:CpsB/CapC family capsule biosynthesis tyrosine phosphatase [Paenibacillus sedimenti]MBD0379772.1 tyrosine protein phosphatase [Paenibacillus sedimenti]